MSANGKELASEVDLLPIVLNRLGAINADAQKSALQAHAIELDHLDVLEDIMPKMKESRFIALIRGRTRIQGTFKEIQKLTAEEQGVVKAARDLNAEEF
jgi:hypothetical protein